MTEAKNREMKMCVGRTDAVRVGRAWTWNFMALLAALGLMGLATDRLWAGSLVIEAIHHFPASGPEPSHPYGGLVQAKDGNLYGSAGGGATSSGTIYRL